MTPQQPHDATARASRHHGRRPLGVGIQLPEVERVVTWSELERMARLAEDVGLDSIWVGDHLLYRDSQHGVRGPWEAWSMLAALAAVTDRMLLGPLVAATSFHNPAMLAKKAVTVDEISGGRLVLGLGAGWNEVEYRAFGFPFDHRVSRFEEAFTIIRGLLRDGAVDFQGHYYSARECEIHPRGPRPQGPPLMIGSMGPRMLRLTVAEVDMWNAWYTWFGNRPEGLAAIMHKVDEACRDRGRDPGQIERTVAVLVGFESGTGRASGEPSRDSSPAISAEPEVLAGVLRAYADAGISHVQLVLDPITLESIERLAPVLERLDRA